MWYLWYLVWVDCYADVYGPHLPWTKHQHCRFCWIYSQMPLGKPDWKGVGPFLELWFSNRLGTLFVTKDEVSSANRFVDFGKGMSFMYIEKSRGLKIAPWGTPANSLADVDIVPLTAVMWWRSARKLTSQISAAPSIPAARSFTISPSCQTRSNAFFKSKKTATTYRPSSTAFDHSCVKRTSWGTVPSAFLKPDWFFINHGLRKFDNFSWTTCS